MKLFTKVEKVTIDTEVVRNTNELPFDVMVEHVLDNGKRIHVFAVKNRVFKREFWAVSHKLPLIVAMAPEDATGYKFNGRKIHWMRHNKNLRKASKNEVVAKPHFKLLP